MFGTDTGVDFGAVTTATCLSAALATAIMAVYARYPIAQAPGMGENFFFVFSALPAATAAGFRNGWQVALGVVFVSGVLFLILSLVGLRELIFNAISPSLKNGIAAGIGLFIAFIGLQQAGVIVRDPGTAVKLNAHFASPGRRSAWHEHRHQFCRERCWGGSRRSNGADWTGGRCSLFAGAVFQSADCNDRRISADHCAGADDCRSNDDAKRGED